MVTILVLRCVIVNVRMLEMTGSLQPQVSQIKQYTFDSVNSNIFKNVFKPIIDRTRKSFIFEKYAVIIFL